MNRPDRMNAYDAEMAQALIEAVENAPNSGVIVLTGTGRASCAGGYLANLEVIFVIGRPILNEPPPKFWFFAQLRGDVLS